MSAATTALRSHLTAGSSATLATCLLALDAETHRSSDERLASAEIVGELIRRFPQINAALDEWADDLENDLTYAEAAVAAIPAGALR